MKLTGRCEKCGYNKTVQSAGEDDLAIKCPKCGTPMLLKQHPNESVEDIVDGLLSG